MCRTRHGVGLALAASLVVLLFAVPPASAEVVDSHVLSFGATPAYVNLNRTTSIAVTIGSSYGPGQDNYRVTVTKPNGDSASAWYNFSSVGTVSLTYGTAGSDFGTATDQVGTYSTRVEHFNGTAFEPAGYATFAATDLLTLTTEAALASNEYTDAHNCPIAQEYQRGSEIIARAYIRYASTGEILNSTLVPSSKGNVTGTLWGVTKSLGYDGKVGRGFWKAAYFINWNETVGTFVFSVQASDGRGNHGSGTSPPVGINAWRLIPATLRVVARIENATGTPTVVFRPGDTVRVEARVTYEGHNQHNKAFPGPLNATRGGTVNAVLGYGAFNATSSRFATTLATLSMAHDAATENWTTTYVVQATDPNRTDLQVVILASDGALNPPNTGSAFTTQFAFEPKPVSPPPTQPPAGTPASGFDITTVGLLAVVALVIGAGVGALVGRRRGSSAAPREGAPEDEWEDEESEEGKR